MKIYEEAKELKKSWSLKLTYDTFSLNCVVLTAVDSETGGPVSDLIRFFSDGKIILCENAKKALEREDYNPHEYGNTFDGNGRIIFSVNE